MSKINDVIIDIIRLGNTNGWFIDFLSGNSAENYITNVGEVIEIDTSCIVAFRDASEDTSIDELDEYLREMIDANIPDANDFQIKLIITDENNYL